jgi:hypothetical protein
MTAMRSHHRRERIRPVAGKAPQLAVLVAVFSAALFVSAAAQQVRDAEIRRFGTVGRSLSENEIEQIERLAKAAGKPPWLVLGLPSMVVGTRTLTVYLHPDVTAGRLRRGRLLRLIAKAPEDSDWMVEATASYAYIPLGEGAGEIASQHDLGWPFAVVGEIDDETLLSLVTFVRSGPPIPGVPEGRAPRRVVSAPLSVVARDGDQFLAGFRTGDASVFSVWLVGKDGKWVVTKWSASIA